MKRLVLISVEPGYATAPAHETPGVEPWWHPKQSPWKNEWSKPPGTMPLGRCDSWHATHEPATTVPASWVKLPPLQRSVVDAEWQRTQSCEAPCLLPRALLPKSKPQPASF